MDQILNHRGGKSGRRLEEKDEVDDEEEEELENAEEGVEMISPIFLPIDKEYEAKYLFHHRFRGLMIRRSWQERIYLFLEHPVGWTCFIYHMTV